MGKKIKPYTMTPPIRRWVPGKGYVWRRERRYSVSAYGRTPKRLGVKPLK